MLSTGLALSVGNTGVTLTAVGVDLVAPSVQVNATTAVTCVAGGARLALTPTGLALTVPLVQVANASAPPTSNPAGGVDLYPHHGERRPLCEARRSPHGRSAPVGSPRVDHSSDLP